MNVALRAVHDALRAGGNPEERWRSLVGVLAERHGAGAVLANKELYRALRSSGVGGTAGEWVGTLSQLGVLDSAGRFDAGKADSVGVALGLVADSFDTLGPARSWAPVATLPPQLRGLLHPPPMRQTAGVLLELIDTARVDIIMAAPFIDPQAVEFLARSLISAGERGVAVRVITSSGQAIPFGRVADRWPPGSLGSLRVTEVLTDLSPLGSHAKVLVVDGDRGYVGSANLTAAGLGRHVEIGVQLAGHQIEELTRVLIALERVGTCVLVTGSAT